MVISVNSPMNEMPRRFVMIKCRWLAMLLGLVPWVLGAQSADEEYVTPRTPEGQPDLQGIWSNAVITPLERPEELADQPFLSEAEADEYERRIAAASNMDNRSGGADADVRRAYNNFWWDRGTNVVATRRTSLIVDPPDGRVPPLTAAALERADERAEARRLHGFDGPEDRPLAERCIVWPTAGPPMLPSAYNNNFQLVQTTDYVLIVNEMIHEARVVPLDGRPPLPGQVRQWLGSSRGRWEGDTLVVETTNFTDQTSFRGASENMRLIERFTRIADDVLLYEFTVDDPDAFEQPWTVQIPAVRQDGLMYEYACHEGNESIRGVLAGARAEEAAAAEEEAEQ
jgi:hypothetical protein